jgi:hypothetical protein
VENISSTLRDSRSGSRGGAGTMLCRTPQGVSINCRRGEQLERHADDIRGAAPRRLRGDARPPGTAALARNELFRRGILGMLRKSTRPPLTFAKVRPHRAKVLAMQRGGL